MGRLAASITHEIAQPISAMATNANSGLRWLTSPTPDIYEAREPAQAVIEDGQREVEVLQQHPIL
jgi:C4-dicarboxylate-specific signal transduction histidine kinase